MWQKLDSKKTIIAVGETVIDPQVRMTMIRTIIMMVMTMMRMVMLIIMVIMIMVIITVMIMIIVTRPSSTRF